jgi:hypothetical protein
MLKLYFYHISINLKLKGCWLKQYIVLVGFLSFDYISTLYYIESPSGEWNSIAKWLMISFDNIFIGMTVFFLSLSIFYYFFHIWWSNKISKTKQVSQEKWKKIIFYNNFGFYFICASDFGFGATSWFWHISPFNKSIVGLALVLLIDKLWIRK